MTTDEVVWDLTRRAWSFGASVLLSPERSIVMGGFPCSGYFCDETKTLAVATGRNEDSWLGVLAHEYCHLTQWVEDQAMWRQYRNDMWDWLDGKRIKNPREAVRTVQALEEDCERRTIRLIREMRIPVDLERYTRSANAYIHFHNVMADKRKWYRAGTVMQEVESLMAAANPTLDRDFSTTPPALRKELEALV